jgi:glycosyltransferase involved in cell wall biosynthesis
MVVRNSVETFADTFQSIEQQTYPNIEIIVIDGGSTDGTLELIREREARIARWISEPDKGAYDGMNKAARLANGRWILFMNAGDFFYMPEAIEIALNGAPEQADFIIGHHLYRSQGVDELHKASDFEDTWSALITGKLSFRWLAGVPCHQATFTRTSMLTVEGGYNGEKHPIAADHEFMYRKRSKGAHFYHCDEIIAVYLSGGYSWLRHTDTVRDWWQIARRYGPPEDVDRFFRASYPVAFAIDHGLAGFLRGVLHNCFGWINSPIRRRFNVVARQGPLYDFGRSVARRAFPKKRPAWFASVATMLMTVDGIVMKANRKRSPESAPNPVMRVHGPSDQRPVFPSDSKNP